MQAGELVADRFEIEAEAGSGGLGVVYRCKDRATGERVALKVLDKSMGRHRDRFVREAELLATLEHPAIVRHVAHGLLSTGEPYLVMQWIDGEDLMQRLERAPLTLEESLALARRVAAALAVAHERGIVHRDVKPANVLLPGRDATAAVLIDFGIARAERATVSKMTLPGGILGTPGYMAPEQARGDSDLDARADVFSVGCLLFECLSGRPAFDGESTMAILAKVLLEQPPALSTLRPDIPSALSALVLRTMSKAKDGRPPNGAALLRELDLYAAGAEPQGPVSVAKKQLTTREQRILSIIVAKLGVAPSTGDTIVDGPEGSQVRPLASQAKALSGHDHTLVVPANVEAVRGAATGLGSRVELLLDGSLIALVEGDGSAADQAGRAVRCALAMRDVCEPGTSLVVATGRGEIAGQLPVGEVIDRAFGIVRDAKGEGVRVDALTARLVEDRFEMTGDELSAILIGERSLDVPSTLRGRATPCVGRDREITTLLGLFDECRDQRSPRVALLTGEPGIGKSRLRVELVHRLRARREPFLLLAGGGDPARSGAPFAMLRQALRRELGVVDGDTPQNQREAIRARIEKTCAPAEVERVAALIGEMVGAPFPDAQDPRVLSARADRLLMGDGMRSAWQDFVEGEARAHPVVLVLEDLHWGDRPSVDFALAAARALHDSPLFVVATARPDARATFGDLFELRTFTQLALEPLSRRACTELGRSILGDVEPPMLDEIAAQSAGNPFFMEELLRAKVEGHAGALPETVLAMAQVRIDALGADARRAARAASVLGDDLCDEGLTALLGGDEAAAAKLIGELIGAELVVRRPAAPGYYDFRHGLFRDAAYASLTAEDRLLAHSLAAAWLEKRPERSALALATHFEKADAPARAAEPYATAAEQAFEGNDLRGALARGERALACGAQGELRGRIAYLLADVHRWLGQNSKSLAYAEEATKLLKVGSEPWIGTQVLLATCSILSGNSAPAAATASTLSLALEAGDYSGHVVRAAARVGRNIAVRRLKVDALPRLLRCLEKARTRDIDPRTLGLVLSTLSVDAEARGDIEEALRLTTEAAETFEHAGDTRNTCHARSGSGFYLLELGQYERAVGVLRESIAVADRLGIATVSSLSKHNLGPCLFEIGDIEGALRTETEAVVAYTAEGDKRLESASRYYLGMMLGRIGRTDDAERELRLAIERADTVPALRVTVESGLAQILLAKGKPEEALAVARRAHDPPEGNVRPELVRSVRIALLEALFATGHRDEARALASESVAEILAHAGSLRTPAFRDSLLERVPENARTLAIARELGVDVPAPASLA